MSVSGGRAPDDDRLRRYVVGSLPADEAEQLDELSVTDDDVAARLRAVENDLVDAYVNGELSGDLLDRFQSHYLASPANSKRVTFAQTLHRHQQRGRSVTEPLARSWAWPARWGLAAAAVFVLAAAGYLLAENIRLRNDVRGAVQAAAQMQERERQLQAQLAQERSANADAAQELARARESLAPGDQRTGSPRPSGLGLLAFTLRPAMRGAEDAQVVVVPRATETIELRLPLETDDHPRYEAVVKSAGTRSEIRRRTDVRSTAAGGVRIVSIAVPVRLLGAGSYTIEVSGIPASGSAEYLSSYPFRVVLQ